jgi:hypothetical protein
LILLIILSLGLLAGINLITSDALAIFHKEDFQITNFGLKDGNPYIQVQGQAGRSFSTDCGDECYYSYVFVTDQGTLASSVANDDDTKPYYSVDHFGNKSFKIGDCIIHKTATGNYKFSGNTAEYIPKNLIFNTVLNVYAIEITLDDPDDRCSTGEHVYKIFSSK